MDAITGGSQPLYLWTNLSDALFSSCSWVDQEINGDRVRGS